MEFQDRELTCQNCSQPFTFSAGEQEFYSRKGFQDDPKRCKPCRDARKQRGDRGERNGNGGGNGYRESNGHAFSGGAHEYNGNHGNELPSGSGNGAGFGGGGNGRQREMHEITCSRCGKPSRVPFRPTAGRPVFCRDCFNQRGADV
jgi:CxxC-x17-CxxC domain-containing protein